MKKKILSVIICAAAILSLTACGKNEDPLAGLGNVSTPSSAATSKPASTKPAQSSSAPAQSSTPEQSSVPESKPEESSVPKDTNKIDWDSVPYADELDFEVEDTDGGVRIYNYLGTDTVVKVPETIDGKKVVEFSGSYIVENGVKYFANGQGVFKNDVTHVKLPDSVSDIFAAFVDTESLVSVNIPSSLTAISELAFFYCTGLTSIEIPNTVTEIGQYAFAESGLESLTVPDSVKAFGGNMIMGCENLKEVSLPQGIRVLYCSYNASVGGITGEEKIDLSDCASLTNTDFLKNVKFTDAPDSTLIAVSFGNCRNLTSVAFPEGVESVTSLGGCEKLTEITLPSSVTNFGGLGRCNNLKKITLSDNLKVLGTMVCPEDAEIVYKGKTYKANQLPNLYKAVNGN